MYSIFGSGYFFVSRLFSSSCICKALYHRTGGSMQQAATGGETPMLSTVRKNVGIPIPEKIGTKRERKHTFTA